MLQKEEQKEMPPGEGQLDDTCMDVRGYDTAQDQRMDVDVDSIDSLAAKKKGQRMGGRRGGDSTSETAQMSDAQQCTASAAV